MSSGQDPAGVVTPSAIITAGLGFFAGAISLAFNPLFAVSLVAILLSLVALRGAARVGYDVVRGVLRIFAVLGIMGALGGIVVIIAPGLGVTR